MQCNCARERRLQQQEQLPLGSLDSAVDKTAADPISTCAAAPEVCAAARDLSRRRRNGLGFSVDGEHGEGRLLHDWVVCDQTDDG